MTTNLSLPIVRPSEVDAFNGEISKVLAGDGFIVTMNPIAPADAKQVDIDAIEERLHALMRLAVQTSYTCGIRVVKIANIGLASGEQPAQRSLVDVANVLNTLIRTDFASLMAFDQWAETGPPATEVYRSQLALVRQALRLYEAMGAGTLETLRRLDLWFETSSSPFGQFSDRVLGAPNWYLLGGHVIHLEEPSFPWTDEEPTVFTRTRSLTSFDLETEQRSGFGRHLLQWVDKQPRATMIVKLRPSEFDLVGPLLDEVAGRVKIAWILIAEDGLDAASTDQLAASLGSLGQRLIGLECRPGPDLPLAVDAASEAIAKLLKAS